METLLQDLRYAGRTLLRARGFAAIAIITLALGIGGTTAIFSVVDGVLLRPLPFPEAERIVVPRSVNLKTGDDWSITYADYVDWRDQKFFQHVALYQNVELDLASDGLPDRVNVAAVTGEFFAVLGVRPTLGRVLQASDNALDAQRVVVISDEVWRSRFGSDSAVLGREVRMNGFPRLIVGVLPAGAEWPQSVDVWVPMKISDPSSAVLQRRDNFVYQAVARLAPGETVASTTSRMAALASRIASDQPQLRADVSLKVIPASEALLGTTLPRALWILLGAVGLVLLIGCVNIANLMLARAGTRLRELAVRTALGASRVRLVQQILTESAVLALLGGVLGVLLAYWSVAALIAAAPPNVPRMEDVTVSLPVLGIALLLSLTSAVLFGLVPAVHASGVRPGQALGEGGQRMAGGKASRRGRGVLVVVELALALMLLTGAGLLTHSLIRLQRTDPGFDTSRVVTMSVELSANYGTSERRAFFATVTEQIGALPGVDTVSLASALPIGAGGFYLGRAFLAEGWAEPPASTEIDGMWNAVSPGYFATLGIPLLQGRDFQPRDDSAATMVMIVNRAFAEKMFPGENPLGKRVQSWRDERILREVVGVVDDVRYLGAEDELRPLVFVPYAQDSWSGMRILARTQGDPRGIVNAARSIVATMDRDIAVAEVATMDDAMAASLASPRFATYLLSGFAGMALLLVAIGLYGVLSYSIAQRTHEIGIRMALGAQVANVIRMVVREAAVLLGIGIVIGAAGALALSRVMESLLYEVSARDPITFVTVVAILAAVGAAAAYLPTKRATRVDPLIALRSGD
jgi:putative ABC transport system permease protein